MSSRSRPSLSRPRRSTDPSIRRPPNAKLVLGPGTCSGWFGDTSPRSPPHSLRVFGQFVKCEDEFLGVARLHGGEFLDIDRERRVPGLDESDAQLRVLFLRVGKPAPEHLDLALVREMQPQQLDAVSPVLQFTLLITILQARSAATPL